MTEKRGMKELELGSTGRRVAERIAHYRNAQALTYQGLSQALTELGWSIPELGLRRIESRARRVTVDDLLALAAALQVSPLDLLFADSGDGEIPTGLPQDLNAEEIHAWAQGRVKLNIESRVSYWASRGMALEDELKEIEALAESPTAGARKYAKHRMAAVKKDLELADRRLEELMDIVDAASDG